MSQLPISLVERLCTRVPRTTWQQRSSSKGTFVTEKPWTSTHTAWWILQVSLSIKGLGLSWNRQSASKSCWRQKYLTLTILVSPSLSSHCSSWSVERAPFTEEHVLWGSALLMGIVHYWWYARWSMCRYHEVYSVAGQDCDRLCQDTLE